MDLAYTDRRGAPRWLLVTAAVAAAITGIAILWIDEPVARALAGTRPLAAVWTFGLDALEWATLLPIFSWAGAILLVAGMVAAVAMRRDSARAWMLVAATHLVARIVTSWIKTGTGRLRPSEWHGGETWGHANGASFPSGHIALFASIVIPLAVVAPKVGRPLMFVVVPFVMIARVALSAHFVSDVTGGVALVSLITWLLAAVIRPLPR